MNNKTIFSVVATIIIIAGGVFALQQFNTSQNKTADSRKGTFDASIANLPEAKPSEVVELKNGDTYDMTASIVKKKIGDAEVKMLTYNGSIPGPMIKVPKGAEITINLTNNTDVETALHSHGVRLANAFDGVPDVTQEPIGIGETFTYKIKFPDEGLYWYHPHVREDYAQELGLYGNYLVASPDSNYLSPVNREVSLMLDDILIENGAIVPFSKESANYALMGRFGNVMLASGETDYSLDVKKGEVVRLFLTNTANTRIFKFSIPGAQMKLVGGDSGKYEKEAFVDSVVLAPSERTIVDALFKESGEYPIVHNTPVKTYRFGTVRVQDDAVQTTYQKEFSQLRENKDMTAGIDVLRPLFDKPTDKRIDLTVDMGAMGSMSGTSMMGGGGHMMPDGTMMGGSMAGMSGEPIEWEDDMEAMNSVATPDEITWKVVDTDKKTVNMDIDWKFKVGDKVKIKITNDKNSAHPMQHPIHFHGQRFLVLNTNGVKNTNLVWKDTTLVQMGDSVEILLDITNPGEWMAHCHIAEHLESGMMFQFEVAEKI